MKKTIWVIIALAAAMPCVCGASVADKLAALENARVAITNAIVAKGGVASGALTNAPNEIMGLPTGVSDIEWRPPEDWPDVEAILAADTENYPFKKIVLMTYRGTNSFSYGFGAQFYKYKGSEETTSSTYHAFRPEDEENGYVWYIGYSSSPTRIIINNLTQESTGWNYVYQFTPTNAIASAAGAWQFDSSLNAMKIKGSLSGTIAGRPFGCQYIEIGNVADTQSLAETFLNCAALKQVKFGRVNANHTYGAFSSCRSLKKISGEFRNETGANSANQMFRDCSSLVDASEVKIFCPCIISANNIFENCVNLKFPPAEIVLTNATMTSAFNRCYSMRKLPEKMLVNDSVSFSTCPINDRDSVAKFDSNASPTRVVGGFVGNLNTCVKDGKTVTFNQTTRQLFSDREIELIEITLTEKNWTVAW